MNETTAISMPHLFHFLPGPFHMIASTISFLSHDYLILSSGLFHSNPSSVSFLFHYSLPSFISIQLISFHSQVGFISISLLSARFHLFPDHFIPFSGWFYFYFIIISSVSFLSSSYHSIPRSVSFSFHYSQLSFIVHYLL